ncbi:MAG: PLP-dependent aminotransferase family protein [Hyphomicrobiales bacterium]
MYNTVSDRADDAHFKPRFADRAERMQASEIRELLKLLDQPGIISFAGGVPDPNLFPLEDVRNAYARALSQTDQAHKALQYSVSEGSAGLRSWIAEHMGTRGVQCAPENILITNGSQQALEFLSRLFISPGDTVLAAAPTYLGALQAFAASEPNYDDLPLEQGNRTAESFRERAGANGGDIKFAYIVPDFANPTGLTVDEEVRRDTLALSAELGVPIVEDAAYTELRFSGRRVPSIQALDLQNGKTIDQSRVIYCGTFSKVFTPGLRVGWVCASQQIISRLVLIKQASDLNSPALNQTVILNLAESQFDEQVTRACAHYAPKRDAMLRALEMHMPDGTTWTQPEGGLFVWVTLPPEFRSADILPKSVQEAKVAFVPGHAFFADGSGTNTMRLSFSLPSVADIEEGIERLGLLLKA